MSGIFLLGLSVHCKSQKINYTKFPALLLFFSRVQPPFSGHTVVYRSVQSDELQLLCELCLKSLLSYFTWLALTESSGCSDQYCSLLWVRCIPIWSCENTLRHQREEIYFNLSCCPSPRRQTNVTNDCSQFHVVQSIFKTIRLQYFNTAFARFVSLVFMHPEKRQRNSRAIYSHQTRCINAHAICCLLVRGLVSNIRAPPGPKNSPPQYSFSVMIRLNGPP